MGSRHNATAFYSVSCIRFTAQYSLHHTVPAVYTIVRIFSPHRSEVAESTSIIHSKRLLKLFMHSAIQHTYFASLLNCFVRLSECAFGLPLLCFCLFSVFLSWRLISVQHLLCRWVCECVVYSVSLTGTTYDCRSHIFMLRIVYYYYLFPHFSCPSFSSFHSVFATHFTIIAVDVVVVIIIGIAFFLSSFIFAK